jgi:hypothetical protein
MTDEVWTNAMASVQRHLAERRGGVDEDAPEPSFEVIESTREVDPATLPTSAKSVLKKATALGWNIEMGQSVTRHDPIFYMKDGAERKDGSQARQGDVRTPAHDETHLVIAAVDKGRTTGFSATWDDGKPSGFRIVDPVGIPIENFVDHWRLKESVKPKDDYNDGTDRIVHRHFFEKITPFNDWLTDWLELLAPESAPKRKAAKKTKEENLLEGADWNG